MRFFSKIAILIFSNSLAIFVAAKIVDGIEIETSWKNYLIAGALLGIVNTFIRPVIKLLSLPFIIITLGFFTIVINVALLFIVSFIIPTFNIEGIFAAFWGVLIISIVNYLISIFIDN
ncbi:MAG: phage holin family protein [Patescibacteria group bacterium]|jgi:putative membrane protein|nr:phage holin family protein [Patescibacteria group bacterium]